MTVLLWLYRTWFESILVCSSNHTCAFPLFCYEPFTTTSPSNHFPFSATLPWVRSFEKPSLVPWMKFPWDISSPQNLANGIWIFHLPTTPIPIKTMPCYCPSLFAPTNWNPRRHLTTKSASTWCEGCLSSPPPHYCPPSLDSSPPPPLSPSPSQHRWKEEIRIPNQVSRSGEASTSRKQKIIA